jgi:hypothetical protein
MARIAAGRTYATPEDWLLADLCEDVTDEFITEAPCDASASPVAAVSVPAALPRRVPYVDQGIIEAVKAKIGASRYDVSELLALIEELNDNYQAEHTYAAHALLRAILDHIPPILGQPSFTSDCCPGGWRRCHGREQLYAYGHRLAARRVAVPVAGKPDQATSNSPSRTPAVNAAHSAGVNVSTGPPGHLESCTAMPPSGSRAQSTHWPLPDE